MSTIAAGLTSTNALVSTGDTSGQLVFQTNGTTTAMTIDTSQNVGIGTSSPTNYSIYGYGPTVESKGGYGGSFVVTNSDSTLKTVFSNASLSVGGILKTITNHPLLFGTNDTERMRIDSSGNLLVGQTAPTSAGKINAKFLGGTYNGYEATNSNSGNTGAFMAFFNSASGLAGYIAQTGVTTVAYNTSSDYRLKENIAPMQNALGVVAQLKPVTYKWKADGSDGQGFIAHELQEVVPDCVTGEKDAVDAEGKPVYQGIDTSFLVATLTKAIQEQQAIINELKSRIETLENK